MTGRLPGPESVSQGLPQGTTVCDPGSVHLGVQAQHSLFKLNRFQTKWSERIAHIPSADYS